MKLWTTAARNWLAGGLTAFGCAGLLLAGIGPGIRADGDASYALALSTGAALQLRETGEAPATGGSRAMTCQRVLRAGGVAVGYRCAGNGQTAALPEIR